MDYLEVNRMSYAIEGAADTFSGEVYADRGWLGWFGPPAYAVTEASAFGNTPAGGDWHAAWEELTGAADLAARRLLHTLQADVRRLGQVIFSFQTTDHDLADLVNSTGTPLTFISSHVHHNQQDLPGERNDEIRGRQLDQVVDYAAEVPGPVIVGSDDNTTTELAERYDVDEEGTEPHQHDDDGPDALNRYGTEGFEDVGDVGPTIGDRTIDHIHARGVPTTAADPTRVGGGPSDHDGQAVTFLLTDW